MWADTYLGIMALSGELSLLGANSDIQLTFSDCMYWKLNCYVYLHLNQPSQTATQVLTVWKLPRDIALHIEASMREDLFNRKDKCNR
jgi:hypothetical protein